AAPASGAERGGPALRLVPGDQPEELLRRKISVAWYHFQAGNTTRARDLLDGVMAAAPPGLTRATAMWRLGQLRAQEDSSLAAAALFTRALADVGTDPCLRAELERDTPL